MDFNGKRFSEVGMSWRLLVEHVDTWKSWLG